MDGGLDVRAESHGGGRWCGVYTVLVFEFFRNAIENEAPNQI